MSRIQETGVNPGAAAAAARTAEKTTQLKAGQALITETVKHVAKEQEELKKEQMESEKESGTDRDKTSEKKDTSELSKQSKWFGIEGKLLKEANMKWTLEMEQELWEALLQWTPVSGQGLSEQIEELSRLYLALLEAILTHTMGEEQAAQIQRLDALLAEKLNLLVDADLKELMELLEKTGQTETLKFVKASVYKQTTGKSISSGSVNSFYAGKTVTAGKSSRYFMPESSDRGAESNRQKLAGYLPVQRKVLYINLPRTEMFSRTKNLMHRGGPENCR